MPRWASARVRRAGSGTTMQAVVRPSTASASRPSTSTGRVEVVAREPRAARGTCPRSAIWKKNGRSSVGGEMSASKLGDRLAGPIRVRRAPRNARSIASSRCQHRREPEPSRPRARRWPGRRRRTARGSRALSSRSAPTPCVGRVVDEDVVARVRPTPRSVSTCAASATVRYVSSGSLASAESWYQRDTESTPPGFRRSRKMSHASVV